MRKVFLAVTLLIISSTSAVGQLSVPDSTGLETYFDGLINGYLQEEHIAGATLGIIKDGQPILMKGYGMADVENGQPVDPDSTLFRVSSISKVFIGTAVMQLVEQGKLDLDQDVNTYLQEVHIPDTYPQPITLKNLLTHTPGFEEYFIGLFARDSSAVKPLQKILSNRMPARVRPPGVLASYSNTGAAIAALVVEQVTGRPFFEYAREHILQPLKMNSTTFRQPVPDSLQPRLSKGYAFGGGQFQEKPFEYVPMGPIASASTTAKDMMHFMQAHLDMGQFKGATLIDSATAKVMHSPAFRHDKAVNSVRLGFYDMSQNGVTIFGHAGDSYWFHSIMALFPNQNMGLFLSLNSRQGGNVTRAVLSDFVDYYFPERTSYSDTLTFSQKYLERFEGSYRSIRYSRERFTKVLALSETFPVSATDDGQLQTRIGGKVQRWLPVDSLTFRKVNSTDNLAFRENDKGEIAYLFRDDMPFNAFEKVPPIERQWVQLSLFVLIVISVGLTLIYWPLVYLIRRKYRPDIRANAPLPFKMKFTAWLNALLLSCFYFGIAIWLIGPGAIVLGVPFSIKVLFALPVLFALGTLAMLFYVGRIWNRSISGVGSRVVYTFLSLIFVMHIWQMYYWNILGFNF